MSAWLIALVVVVAAGAILAWAQGRRAPSGSASQPPPQRHAQSSAPNEVGEQSRFWRWFQSADLDTTNPEAIVQEVGSRLRQVDERLKCEILISEQSKHELVISADGISAVIESVQELCDAAPEVPGWKVVAFRPRAPENYGEFSIEMSGASISGDDIQVHLEPDGELIHVHLFVDDCPELNDPLYTHIMFLWLDMAIGEYDVMTKVGAVVVYPPDVPEGVEVVTGSEFRDAFDTMHEALGSTSSD